MKRGQVYWLEDTEYTANRVERGHIEPAEEPEWNKVSPDPWPKEEHTTTATTSPMKEEQ